MNYSFLIDDMTWSHSRISSFEDCPYKFFLRYINPHDDQPLFFSQYGKFIHSLLADYYSGACKLSSLPMRFIASFRSEVSAPAPSAQIYTNYFMQGLQAMRTPFQTAGRVIDVERKFDFTIDGKPFVGFADLIIDDPDYGLCIVDHKSKDLKPRSIRKPNSKTNQLLDRYFRQLYLYALAMQQSYGRLPDSLCFNCYRTGVQIFEPLDLSKLDKAKEWAAGSIEAIHSECAWRPNLNSFSCKHICGFHNACAYYQMSGGDKR